MSDGKDKNFEATPLACNLPDDEQAERRKRLDEELISGIQEIKELADGYAFRFPGGEEWASRIFDFTLFERRCCPFLTFELTLNGDGGPIWLGLRGGPEIKKFLERDLINSGSLQF